MKTQWQVPGFSLDLSHLWDVSDSISVSKDWEHLFNQAWTQFKSKTDRKTVGFFDWPVNAEKGPLQEIESLCKTMRSRFQGALCIGIGGSYLGPAALQEILNPCPASDSFKIHWLSNVDSTTIHKAIQFIESNRSLAVIISKSGTTTETLAAWFHLSKHFTPESVVVITDPKNGELRRLSKELGWHSLSIPPEIGGRFSVLTSVGLFPLGLQGLNISELIEGARASQEYLNQLSPSENPAIWYAYAKYLWDKKGVPVHYLMPYDSRLKLLADWYVQLWAESLGKKQLGTQNSVGPNPVSALGTSDQHSLLQLFKEGPRQRLVGFLNAREKSPLVGPPSFQSPDFSYLSTKTFWELNQLASEATEKSLHLGQVPTYRFSLENFSSFSLGSFILFQETACAIAGELYGVNAFDQPGVEETKLFLKKDLIR